MQCHDGCNLYKLLDSLLEQYRTLFVITLCNEKEEIAYWHGKDQSAGLLERELLHRLLNLVEATNLFM